MKKLYKLLAMFLSLALLLNIPVVFAVERTN